MSILVLFNYATKTKTRKFIKSSLKCKYNDFLLDTENSHSPTYLSRSWFFDIMAKSLYIYSTQVYIQTQYILGAFVGLSLFHFLALKILVYEVFPDYLKSVQALQRPFSNIVNLKEDFKKKQF